MVSIPVATAIGFVVGHIKAIDNKVKNRHSGYNDYADTVMKCTLAGLIISSVWPAVVVCRCIYHIVDFLGTR